MLDRGTAYALYLLCKMALTDRVEINIANNAELRANAQHVLAITRGDRPKNTSLTYEPNQKEFKVRRTLIPPPSGPSIPPPFFSPKRVAPTALTRRPYGSNPSPLRR